jgi:putative transposase
MPTQRRSYDSDLTDDQWAILEPLLPKPKTGGRPSTVDPRAVCNAILYLVRTGCEWRYLPHDLPPWSTVYRYFRYWKRSDTTKRVHDALVKKVRRKKRKKVSPSAGIIDSQSVKTTEKRGSMAMTEES